MARTVLNKLRKIDIKLANKVSRRKIGSLIGRLYFQREGSTTWEEVPIVEFTDQGVSSKNFRTGNQVEGQRFSVRAGRDWWDSVSSVRGNYAIRPSGDTTQPLIHCDLEGHVADDKVTTVTLELIIALQIQVEI